MSARWTCANHGRTSSPETGSMSSHAGEYYPYSGQSFVRPRPSNPALLSTLTLHVTTKLIAGQDACEYTACPVAANKTREYTYEFATLNNVCPISPLSGWDYTHRADEVAFRRVDLQHDEWDRRRISRVRSLPRDLLCPSFHCWLRNVRADGGR